MNRRAFARAAKSSKKGQAGKTFIRSPPNFQLENPINAN